MAADFRLYDDAKRQPITELSMKVVQVAYEGGVSGLITYTGIGRARGKYTADFICEWLDGMPGLDLEDVGEVLRSKGSAWLKSLRQQEIPKHTFVIAGFDRSQAARITVVSNFQHADGGSEGSAAAELRMTSRTVRTARVLVTGLSDVVRRERRKLLARTVDDMPLDSARIKASMLRIIEDAAKSGAAEYISPQGGAISLVPEGASSLGMSEPLNVEAYWVSNGLAHTSMRRMLQQLGVSGGSLGGMTSVHGQSAPIHQDACTRSIEVPSGGAKYELSELPGIGDGRQFGIAINLGGTVLGASQAETGLVKHWLRNPMSEAKELPVTHPSYFTAGGIDMRGVVYIGVGGHQHGPARIVRWSGTEEQEMAALDGLPSSLVAVAPSGWVAGSVEVFDDATRADRVRPARWSPEGLLEVGSGLPPGGSCTAVGIASDGDSGHLVH